jgi:hypothetical protein
VSGSMTVFPDGLSGGAAGPFGTFPEERVLGGLYMFDLLTIPPPPKKIKVKGPPL